MGFKFIILLYSIQFKFRQSFYLDVLFQRYSFILCVTRIVDGLTYCITRTLNFNRGKDEIRIIGS